MRSICAWFAIMLSAMLVPTLSFAAAPTATVPIVVQASTITSSPASLSFTGALGNDQTITLTQSGNTTGYTVGTPSVSGIVSYPQFAAGASTLDITSQAAGATTIPITGANGAAITISVTVGTRPTPAPTTSPSASPAPTSTPTGTVVWQAGISGKDYFENATTYQCGSPNVSGASFLFNFSLSGTNCGRNQAQPTTDNSGTLVRMTDGQQYTWTFDYIDGTRSDAAPGMGYDQDARSLIWQIHPYGGGNPCTGLNFDNGGTVGAAQEWVITNCNGNVWTGTYTPQETDHWVISVLISQTSSGYIKAYRNGTYLGQWSGATYNNNTGSSPGSGNPWFNFGPYKWRWELANGGGSTMTTVNATINNMTVTTP